MKLSHLLTVLLLASFVSCGKEDSSSSGGSSTPPSQESRDPLKEVHLVTRSGETIETSLAYKSADQVRGLSGTPSEEFENNDGKLFFYFTEATRTFWMPNMFFALDIFYLDQNMKVERIVRDLPFERDENGQIPRAPAIESRHVLEMKADSPIANGISEGDQLQWNSSLSIEETEEKMKENL